MRHDKKYIVLLEQECWLAPWSGDPGRTCVKGNAMKYKTIAKAAESLARARKWRPFSAAEIVEIGRGS